MKVFLYSIRDTKAGYYNPPYVSPNSMTAARDFQLRVREDNSLMGKFPEDYQLEEVGAFDYETGKVTPREEPVLIVTAAQMLAHEAR